MARRRPPPRPGPPGGQEPPGAGPVPELSGRHRATLAAIFDRPTRADLAWRSVESLLVALGGEVTQGRGSRVRVALRGSRAVFHEPHPEPDTAKGAVEDVRDFLLSVGVRP